MKTEIPNWPSVSDVKVKMLNDNMPTPPYVIYRRIRSIEEYKALPDTIVEYGFEYKKIEDNAVRRNYPYAICIRKQSRCTACSCAETVCKYKRTGATYAIYTRK